MHHTAFTLHPAVPADLDALLSIDDDACAIYAQHGLNLALPPDSEFVLHEQARWHRSLSRGWVFIVKDAACTAVAFAALANLDGQPYLDQLSVRSCVQRRGLGALLLEQAVNWAHATGGKALWLSTYAQLPFNAPYYSRHGFELVPASAWGPEIAAHLEEQRRYLPEPQQRVVMRRLLERSV